MAEKNIENYLYHRRMHKFENVDKITIEVTSKFKDGALSGGKWQSAAHVHFFFKGTELFSSSYKDIRTALAAIPWEVETLMEKSDHETFNKSSEQERKCCDQPGCSNTPSVYVKINKITSSNNELLDRTENNLPFYRKFCAEHDIRGTADQEDNEFNYTEFDPNTVRLGG